MIALVRGYVVNADAEWHAFLEADPPTDDINLWHPAGGRFDAIEPGEPVFFRIQQPRPCIAGFGVFARYECLPLQLAWECFGPYNGAPDLESMLDRVRAYFGDQEHIGPTHEVGCMMISNAVILDPRWPEPEPHDWEPRIEHGKAYSIEDGEGRRIWEDCLARISPPPSSAANGPPQLGLHFLLGGARPGEGTFRASVTIAYDYTCAITHETAGPDLQATHIRPLAVHGRHAVSNGLALRSDLRRLFEAGFVTVTPELRVEVSGRIKQDLPNARSYQPLHGRSLRLPARASDHPDPAQLRWHNEHCYNG
jgi:putative restriction endonuclease